MVKEKSEKHWKPVASSEYEDESKIQKLLQADISLIPIEPPLIAAAREFGLPGSGSSDIVAVTEDGSITIVECKLAKNRDVRRKVIGQLLEYAAYLSKMTNGDFVRAFDERAETPLHESIAERLGDEFDSAAFNQNLSQNLKEGRFTLIVAVDSINEELKEIVLYLNAHSDCTVGALELEYFNDNNSEYLIPHLYGGTEVKEALGRETRPSRTKKWNKESFLKALREYNVNEPDEEKFTEKELKAMEELIDFTAKASGQILWGRGQYEGSFQFAIFPKKKDKSTIIRIFAGWSTGSIAIHSGDIERGLEPANRKAIISEFWSKLKSSGIESFEEENHQNKYYRTWLDVSFLSNPKFVKSFEEAILWLSKKIRAYEGD